VTLTKTSGTEAGGDNETDCEKKDTPDVKWTLWRKRWNGFRKRDICRYKRLLVGRIVTLVAFLSSKITNKDI